MAKRKVPTNFKPPPGRHFIKEWREYRGFTQDGLAEAIGMSTSTINQLESGKQGFSQVTFESIARVLHIKPGWLFSIDPHDKSQVAWTVFDTLTEQEKRLAIDMVNAIKAQRKDDKEPPPGEPKKADGTNG